MTGIEKLKEMPGRRLLADSRLRGGRRMLLQFSATACASRRRAGILCEHDESPADDAFIQAMLDACVIRRTGQGRKAILAFTGLLLVAGIDLLALAFPHQWHSGMGVTFDLVGIVVALGFFFFACRAIRCPACRTQWVWNAMRQQSASRWLYALLSARVCPVCGYPDGLSAGRSDTCAGQ